MELWQVSRLIELERATKELPPILSGMVPHFCRGVIQDGLGYMGVRLSDSSCNVPDVGSVYGLVPTPWSIPLGGSGLFVLSISGLCILEEKLVSMVGELVVKLLWVTMTVRDTLHTGSA